MQVKLTKYYGFWMDMNADYVVCDEMLRRNVKLPSGVATIYGVFTRRKYKCSFELNRPKVNGYRLYPALQYRGHTNTVTLSTLDSYVETAWKKGYRYVHVEY